MPLNFTTWEQQFTVLTAVTTDSSGFVQLRDGAIDYAEGRIYREIDLLATRVTANSTSTLVSSGNRSFTLPSSQGTFLVVEGLNIISPSTATASNGTRNPVLPVSREFIDIVYPSNSNPVGIPSFYARTSDSGILFGPAPDAPYVPEVIGTMRPTALSSGNSSTYLTQLVPDLFMAGTMVFAAGWMRNFGSQADDPRMSQSWETQYTTLFKSAGLEEVRKKFQAEGWSDKQPSPVATPPRV